MVLPVDPMIVGPTTRARSGSPAEALDDGATTTPRRSFRRSPILALVLLLGSGAQASERPAQETTRDGGAVAYGMVRHPASGVEVPRIRLPQRPDVEKSVNARLDSLAESLRCDDKADGHYFNARLVVTHAASDVLSVQVGSSYYCGGAYPTHDADQSMTFDLRTGQEVEFAALFADHARDRDVIARIFVNSLPAENFTDCEDVLNAESLRFFAFTISTKGLRLKTTLPHSVEACNSESTLPFDRLRPFAAPGGVLMRVADAAAARD